MNMELDYIVRATGGELVMPSQECPAAPVTGVVINSRDAAPGALFVALRGERRDGHEYIADAVANGAAAVLAETDFQPLPPVAAPVVVVPNTYEALQRLAHSWRMQFDLPVIAVTGSVGKTGTKDMLAACLQALGPVLKTEGNFNNELGLPLTLLNLDPAFHSAVVEMGMRALGEIRALAAIARPRYAIITTVEPVHLETLGSLENIARAKAEVLEYIGSDGFALINGDQPLLREAAARHPVKLYRFGWREDCELRILRTHTEAEGLSVQLQLLGEPALFTLPLPVPELAVNLAAAAGMAKLLGVSAPEIKRALAGITFSKLRLQISALPAGGLVINDTYNASPPSMKAGLGLLKTKSGSRRSVAVLGDMMELGSYERQGHREVGARAAELGIDLLLTVGPRAEDIAAGACQAGQPAERVQRFADAAACLEWMRAHVTGGDAVLFKASRGMQLEALLEAWLEAINTEESV